MKLREKQSRVDWLVVKIAKLGNIRFLVIRDFALIHESPDVLMKAKNKLSTNISPFITSKSLTLKFESLILAQDERWRRA